MSTLNQLLDRYAPPPASVGLATRAAAAAVAERQERRSALPWRRDGARGGWRRGVVIGSAALGLAFTSAVAAEVVSGGRIEIPVAHQVVEAVPILKATAHQREHGPQLASLERKRVIAKPAIAAPSEAPAATPAAASPRDRFLQKFADAKRQVAERRAAGLPTPNADRIERKAQQIVERRQAAGLPAPALDQVEQRVALREWRTTRLLRQVARDPSAINDAQLQRFSRILPPQRREQFLALDPEQQRAQMGRAAERFLARRAGRQMQAANQPPANLPAPPPR